MRDCADLIRSSRPQISGLRFGRRFNLRRSRVGSDILDSVVERTANALGNHPHKIANPQSLTCDAVDAGQADRHQNASSSETDCRVRNYRFALQRAAIEAEVQWCVAPKTSFLPGFVFGVIEDEIGERLLLGSGDDPMPFPSVRVHGVELRL